MALRKLDASVCSPAVTDGIVFNVNNGDLQAINETVARLGFKDEESLLRFMLAIMAKSATRSVTITDQNGTKSTLTPSEGLLKPGIND